MSLYDSINKSSDSATDIGKKYVKDTISYAKLKAFLVTTSSISVVTKLVLIGGLVTLGILFMSVALALELGDYFESFSLGLLSVGGIYIILGLFMFFGRKTIDKKIIKGLSDKFFKK
jgi:hypothetical protein